MTLANILWPSVCQIRQSQPRHSAPVTASIVWYVIHCTRLDDVQPDWQTAMCLPCQPSSVTILTCCIPQYSVLGPIYTADILTIVAKHGLHDHLMQMTHRSVASVILISPMSSICGLSSAVCLNDPH